MTDELTARYFRPEPKILLNGNVGDLKFGFFPISLSQAMTLLRALEQAIQEAEADDGR